jgi:acetyltransferase
MTASPLRPFFEPRSVAVIGASRKPGKPGYQQIENLRRGFSGPIYPINPNAEQILGLPCYASIELCPGPVDLAIVLVPATSVLETVTACAANRVPAVMIPASGFAEAGSDGKRLQSAILDIVRGSGTRIWGPNCGGLMNTANGLTAAFIDLPYLRKGSIGIVSQTGLYAAALMNQMMEIDGYGVSKVATLGNACDVNEIDVLEYLAADPETSVIALHLEGITDGARLLQCCQDLTRKKPIVAVMAGQTEAGAKAGASHTARLAADARITKGAFAQSGIIPATEFTDLIDLTRALAVWQGAAPAKNVAVLSTSGGACVLAADMIARAGMKMAAFSPATVARLAKLHPFSYGVANPFDVWPAMERHGTNRTVEEIAEAVFDDEGVDAAVLIFGAFSSGGSDLDPRVFGDMAKRRGKIAVAWLYGARAFVDPWIRSFAEIQIPCFHDMRTAIAALQASDSLARYRNQAIVESAKEEPEAKAVSAEIIATARARGDNTLTPPEARRLLDAWCIRSAPETRVEDEAGAIDAAEKIGYPIALKVVSPDIQHKVDVGAVALDIRNADELRESYARIMREVDRAMPAARIDGVLVQAMVVDGREVIVGATRTVQFDMVLMLGLGGSYVEVFGEVGFRLPPLGPRDIDEMIDQSGVGALLNSDRGHPPADRAALETVLAGLSALVESSPGLDQIEINPLLVLDGERGAVAVDVLVVLGDATA